MKYTAVILDSRTPTANGNLYPPPLLKKIVEQASERIAEGRFFGELYGQQRDTVELINVAIKVTRIWEEDGKLLAEVEPLPTPKGLIAVKALESNKFKLAPQGYGTVTQENHIKIVGNDYQLLSVSVIPTEPYEPEA